MENFITTDLGIASYLSMKGFLFECDKTNPKRIVFEFKRKQGKKIEDVVDEYKTHQALVEPRAFFNAIRDVKNTIYSNF